MNGFDLYDIFLWSGAVVYNWDIRSEIKLRKMVKMVINIAGKEVL